MRRAIKCQVLTLVALLVLVIMLSGILTASGGNTSTSSGVEQPKVTEPAAQAGVQQPTDKSNEPGGELKPLPKPKDSVTVPGSPPIEPGAPLPEPGAPLPEPAAPPTSLKQATTQTPGVTVTAGADEQVPVPQFIDGPLVAVVEALIYEDTNADGVYNEPLILIDGVTVSLSRLEPAGGQTFISSKVSGPGGYGPFGIPLFPWPGGWVGWNQLPTSIGEQPFVDYALELTVPPGYYSTNGTTRVGRVWAQNLEHPVCWWRYFYLEDGAFALARKSKITGYKFRDMNENGKKDEGEEGIGGVTIKLNDDEQTAVTNGEGYYSFDVKPGTYTVAVDETTAPGYYPTSPTSLDVEVAAGQQKDNNNFGNAPYGSISGHKWEDEDKDGKHEQDNPPVKGVTIKLTGTTNVGGETVNLETVTGDDGSYSFTNLKAGSYTVSEEVDTDIWLAVSPADGTIELTLTPGQEAKDVDFLNQRIAQPQPGSISGHKWNDKNRNGKKDSGELPIAGVTIKLVGTTVTGQAVSKQTTTGADGSFSFTGLEAGAYTVSEEVPVGWDATSDVSVGVTLTTGQNLTGIDFLNAQQGGQPEPTPTPGTTTTTPTTLPHTGMNQVPMSVTAGLSILLGLAMLIAGIVRRRQQQLLLARTSATVSGREWK